MTPHDRMTQIDELLSHVWMVRTFLKHSEEAEEIEELREVHRELYDYMLAVGEPWTNRDAEGYLKLAHKKYARLKRITEHFVAAQPDISAAHEASDGGEVVGGGGRRDWEVVGVIWRAVPAHRHRFGFQDGLSYRPRNWAGRLLKSKAATSHRTGMVLSKNHFLKGHLGSPLGKGSCTSSFLQGGPRWPPTLESLLLVYPSPMV